MNVNDAVQTLRDLANLSDQNPGAKGPEVDRATEAWHVLDSHLSNGGKRPDAWKRNK